MAPTTAAIVLLVVVLAGVHAATRPNFVFIFADDLGWNDVGFHNPAVHTPNLNGLAAAGIILNQSYVETLCSPSRAAFLTGRKPFKIGMQHHVLLSGVDFCLPLNLPTLPEKLRDVGYKNHIVGKWHQGYCNKKCLPTQRGFDSFLGHMEGANGYFDHVFFNSYDMWKDEEIFLERNQIYNTELFQNHAVEIIENHTMADPLFMYFTPNSPHLPLEVPDSFKSFYTDPNMGSSRKTHLAMVSSLDAAVGKVVDALKAKGIYDNTILVFSADNGGLSRGRQETGNNYPLRGGKSTVYEGGTRAVGFIHSPLLSHTGITRDGLMHVTDWFPTFLDLAGAPLSQNESQEIDGVSQKSFLMSGTASARNEVVYKIDSYNTSSPVAAVRVGEYKLIESGNIVGDSWRKPSENTGPQITGDTCWKMVGNGRAVRCLFNVEDDPSETRNLYDDLPDIVSQLSTRLSELRQQEVTALWSREQSDISVYTEIKDGLRVLKSGYCTNPRTTAIPFTGQQQPLYP